MKVANPVDRKILARVKQRGTDWVFSPADFIDLGTRPAVDKALSRMAAAGSIRRVARGLYDVPKQHPIVGTTAPSIDQVAKAVAGKGGTRLQPTGAYAASRLDELEQAARYFLAWQSVVEQETELNLDKSQSRQAVTQKQNWDRATASRIRETYQWLLVPAQQSPQAPVEWQASRLSGPDLLTVRACKKLRNDSQMVMQYAPTLLRQELDRIPLWRGNHVAVKQLVEDFARYPYLQRVRTPEVLLDTMRDGVALVTWRTDGFAFADGFEEAKGRYAGLRAGQVVRFSSDAIGLLVKPDVADIQIQSERPTTTAGPGSPGAETTSGVVTGDGLASAPPAAGDPAASPAPPPTLFFGSVKVDTTRISRDVAAIANEIIQHLAALPDSEVDVTLEIQARVPGGVPDGVIRTVSENCRTLKFNSQHFEKE